MARTVRSGTWALIAATLGRRRERGVEPFTVMSCDNLQGNGEVARTALTTVARLNDPGLADWIDESVSFPDTMVDRITPITTDADRATVRDRFGVEDRWPVVCEPFVQWVLEDDFSAGRPPYETAGVQVVPDIAPYEMMKIRLLNGSHQALAYFAYLCGYRLVHEAVQDELFRPVARLCESSSDRIPAFALPAVRDQLATGGELRCSAAVVASWALRQREEPDAFLADAELFDGLPDDERFMQAYREALASLHANGARATLAALV